MIRKLFIPLSSSFKHFRSFASPVPTANIINGRALARDMKSLLKKEVEIWAKSTFLEQP